MRGLFNYRWHHLSQFCWWFGELSSNRRAVEFPQPSWLCSANCAYWLTTPKQGFSLWMKLSLDALLTIPHCWGHFQENRKENAEKERLEMTKCFDHLDSVVNGFGWKYTSNHFSPAFLDKAFWSFVLNCHYFEICLHFERWKKMEAVRQQEKELWSLNKGISF